jgi:hypothetical protein
MDECPAREARLRLWARPVVAADKAKATFELLNSIDAYKRAAWDDRAGFDDGAGFGDDLRVVRYLLGLANVVSILGNCERDRRSKTRGARSSQSKGRRTQTVDLFIPASLVVVSI